MTSDPISLTACELDPTQLWAALLIARCYSQTEAAQITSTPLRTVQRWVALPEFREEVRAQQDEIASGFKESFSQLIENSIRVIDLATRGEISADDARVHLAQDTLSKTAYRVAGRNGTGRSVPGGDVPPQLSPGGAA